MLPTLSPPRHQYWPPAPRGPQTTPLPPPIAWGQGYLRAHNNGETITVQLRRSMRYRWPQATMMAVGDVRMQPRQWQQGGDGELGAAAPSWERLYGTSCPSPPFLQAGPVRVEGVCRTVLLACVHQLGRIPLALITLAPSPHYPLVWLPPSSLPPPLLGPGITRLLDVRQAKARARAAPGLSLALCLGLALVPSPQAKVSFFALCFCPMVSSTVR
ncbi:hypothetical protein H4582DRAFT_1979970 [Lactarius indigo]|nr:hypothetical protein H4582DRAFT_1979970 [Lactarius indigo]